MCGRLLGCPVVWHVRDLVPEGRALALFRNAADRLPRGIIANSGAVAAQFAGCRAAAYTHTIHNAVDPARFRPARPAAEVRESLCLEDGLVLLAMVAHFTRWKGHLLFLEVMARLVEARLPVAGLIVGGSIYRTEGHRAYEAEVHARCRALGLAGRVRFAGFQENVADFLNAADILVHPPTLPEPFGRVVIEAMALGRPVVAAAAGGILEIVESGVTGLLIPPGDAGAFAAALRPLIEDAALRAALGRRGRARVAKHFDPARHVARIERLYQEIARCA
jgi:glycosyltransferase involved in cell wall biosynthesis